MDSEDEEIERRDTDNMGEEDDVGEVEHEDNKEKNRDEGDEEMECSRDDSNVEMNDPDSVGMRDNDIESESDSESEVQTSRKRHRPQTMLRSSKRHKKSAVISGALDFIVDRESNSDFDPDAASQSEFSEDEDKDKDKDSDEEFVDEDIARMQDSSRISKQEQRRWEKRDKLTSVLKAKTLYSIHLAGTTREESNRWYGRKLQQGILQYMDKIRKRVIGGDIRIRHVLAG